MLLLVFVTQSLQVLASLSRLAEAQHDQARPGPGEAAAAAALAAGRLEQVTERVPGAAGLFLRRREQERRAQELAAAQAALAAQRAALEQQRAALSQAQVSLL